MDTDWWARGIGLAALVVALASLGWLLIEYRLTGRASVEVVGSAGLTQATEAGPKLFQGKRFGFSHVVVEVINKGRRPVNIETVGFRVPGGTRLIQMEPGIPETLPRRLDPGEKVTVLSTAESFLEGHSDDLDDLRPYCKDAEGQMHAGKVNHHYRDLLAAYRSRSRSSEGV